MTSSRSCPWQEHQGHGLRDLEGDVGVLKASKVLSALVENKPGALFRVVHLVRLMRLNIDGLTCGETNGGEDVRITITLEGDDGAVEHVARQLMKVIDVLEAHTYSPEEVTAKSSPSSGSTPTRCR